MPRGAPYLNLYISIAKSGKAVYMLQAHAKIPKPRQKPVHKKYGIKQDPRSFIAPVV